MNSTKRRAQGVFAALLAAYAVFGCSDGGSSPKVGGEAGIENLLLITFDTTRADHLGCYGSAEAFTPVLDKLAREGVLFENCMAVAPITLPTHTSILTGLYPFNHGARNNGTHYVPAEVTTLAEVLQGQGFDTGAVVSALVLDSRYGLDQGFDEYDDDLSAGGNVGEFVFPETTADNTARRAIRWLDERGEERWFLWLHFFDPHAIYAPPAEFAAKCSTKYDGEIAFADDELGRVLDSLRKKGELDETLVLMTADHGENLGEHEERSHSLFVYDATSRIPLIMRHPALAQGHRIEEVVSQVDMAPTVLDLLGVRADIGRDGRSLARAALDDDYTLTPEPAYTEGMASYYNHGWSDLRAVRDERGRYIRAPREELYDIGKDAGEVTNLLPGEEARATVYQGYLESFLSSGDTDMRAGDSGDLPEDMREAFAALGYVWSASIAAGPEGRLDPKDGVKLWNRNMEANDLIENGHPEQAEVILLQLLKDDPLSVPARTTLCDLYSQSKRFEEARDLLRTVVEMPGVQSRMVLRLAQLERDLGGDWRSALTRAKQLDPRDPEAWAREGEWLGEDGDATGAEASHMKALELDDRSVVALTGLGNIEKGKGNYPAAEIHFQQAIAADPTYAPAWFFLGICASEREDIAAARGFYEKAIAVDDVHVPSLVNLAGILRTLPGHEADAERYLLKAVEADPETFFGYLNLGALYMAQRNAERALWAYQHATQLDASQVDPWLQLMVIHRILGNVSSSLTAAEAVLRIRPQDAKAHLIAGLACEATGRLTDADTHVRAALASSPQIVQQLAQGEPALAVILARVQ
jgi:choline-sulfatase